MRAAAAALSTHELKARELLRGVTDDALLTWLVFGARRVQDLESSVIAVRNQKLKEEKEAQMKGKKGA